MTRHPDLSRPTPPPVQVIGTLGPAGLRTAGRLSAEDPGHVGGSAAGEIGR